MNITVIPTMRMFNNFIRPLRELGYWTFKTAVQDGVITEKECNFLITQIGELVPTEFEFRTTISARLAEIPK